MGLLKSMKSKLSSKDGRDEQVADSPQEQKYTYQPQSSSPEISYDDNKTLFRSSNRIQKQSHDPTIDNNPVTYAPPPGHPTDHASSSSTQPHAPEVEANPPPYESWLAVPDNSQLPPPPSFGHTHSPANNASFDSAATGHEWCRRNKIYHPSIPNPTLLDQSTTHELNLESPPPPAFTGTLTQLDARTWRITSPKSRGDQDACITSTLPVYFARVSNPLLTQSQEPHEIRFTTTITHLPSSSSSSSGSVLAVGVTAKPYPPFRLPGWHRGSVAVHSDDGRRYTNDPDGGVEFVPPFRVHDQIVFKFTIYPRPSPVQVASHTPRGVQPLPQCVCKVEVERNGRYEGGWDVCGERDADMDLGIEGGVQGLQGESDLYVAVGVCGSLECEVRFG